MAVFTLAAGNYTAQIDSLSAALCSVEHGGRALIVPHTPGTISEDYRGVVCVPWPNRIADGQYEFRGHRYQLPVNEPDKNVALHGLGVGCDWEVLSHDHTHVRLALHLGTEPGYPFAVRVEVRYELEPEGLRAHIRGINEGQTAAPYGSCPHPYLVAGPGRVDDWTLHVVAGRYLKVSPDRLLPTALASVAGGSFDFRTPRPIGDLSIDNAFTDVEASPTRECVVRLTAADGHGVALSWDRGAAWVQLHTGDHIVGNPRGGMAVEPTDCPPDTFNSGADLVILEPGAEHSLSWRLRAI